MFIPRVSELQLYEEYLHKCDDPNVDHCRGTMEIVLEASHHGVLQDDNKCLFRSLGDNLENHFRDTCKNDMMVKHAYSIFYDISSLLITFSPKCQRQPFKVSVYVSSVRAI